MNKRQRRKEYKQRLVDNALSDLSIKKVAIEKDKINKLFNPWPKSMMFIYGGIVRDTRFDNCVRVLA